MEEGPGGPWSSDKLLSARVILTTQFKIDLLNELYIQTQALPAQNPSH